MNYREKIYTAYKKGRLHLHVLECALAEIKLQQRDFFEVLNGNPHARFENDYRNVKGTLGEGYVGIATAALKEGYPVKAYPYGADVGLLFVDEGKRNFQPLFFNDCDAGSRIDGNILSVSPIVLSYFSELRRIQGLSDGSTKLDIATNREDRIKRARAARNQFWEFFRETPWDEYDRSAAGEYRGCNEMVSTAHSSAVNGIVVISRRETNATSNKKLLAAIELRDWINETYPDLFPEKLPIYSYKANREHNRLSEIPERDCKAALEWKFSREMAARG